MPLDPQVAALLEKVAASGAPPLYTLPPAEGRALMDSRPKKPGPDVASIKDAVVPGKDTQVPVRIYTPEGSPPLPATIWLHGGGWTYGSIETNDATCRVLANESGCVVVSVDYRLSPETKYPGALQDTYDATIWTIEHAEELGVDPERVAVSGASAGGNLAAAVSLQARDQGGPKIAHQLMIYPVLDHTADTASYQSFGKGYNLDAEQMKWHWDLYLENDSQGADPYASPLKAHDLSGLPSASVFTCEYDPLQDEGEAYAQRLKAAGVDTSFKCYEGMIHGFFNAAAPVDRTWVAIAEAGAALKAALKR